MKKIIALVLAAMMVLSMAACGGSGETSTTEATKASTTEAATTKATEAATKATEATTEASTNPETWVSDEKLSITIGVPESAVIEDWETNAQTLLLEEDCNVDLTFTLLPADKSECLQKIELMVMAGGDELPDILMGVNFDSLATITQYGQMGMFVNCTEYYETIATNTLASLELAGYTLDERLAYVTSADGNVYGVFGFADTVHNAYSNDMSFVYQPYLDKLGLDMPTTTDEFKEMLIAFRDNDLDGDGDTSDEIPYLSYKDNLKTAQIRFFMNPFIYTQEHYVQYNEETGEVEFVANTDEWKEGIKWVKSLYDEGLYTSVSMTQDQASFNATCVGTDGETHVCVLGRISSSNFPATDARRTEYALMNPLTGPDGECNAVKQPTLPSIKAVITKNAEDPEACFKFLDYMCSEKMSVWTRYGEYGVDYVDAPEGSVGTFEKIGYSAKLKTITSWGTLQNKWWAQIGPNILPASWGSGQAAVVEEGNYASSCAIAIGENLQTWMDVADPNPIYGMVYNDEEQEVITEYISTLDDYVLNTWAEFVTGTKDIDKDWDAYVAEFDKMGLDEVLDAMTSCYNRMFK